MLTPSLQNLFIFRGKALPESPTVLGFVLATSLGIYQLYLSLNFYVDSVVKALYALVIVIAFTSLMIRPTSRLTRREWFYPIVLIFFLLLWLIPVASQHRTYIQYVIADVGLILGPVILFLSFRIEPANAICSGSRGWGRRGAASKSSRSKRWISAFRSVPWSPHRAIPGAHHSERFCAEPRLTSCARSGMCFPLI